VVAESRFVAIASIGGRRTDMATLIGEPEPVNEFETPDA
jgi:hypothetical protein